MEEDKLFVCPKDAQEALATEIAEAEKYQNEKRKKEAKTKGRPRKNRDGAREANPMEFGGGAINYARKCIRDAFKAAIGWARFASDRKANLDLHEYLEKEMKR